MTGVVLAAMLAMAAGQPPTLEVAAGTARDPLQAIVAALESGDAARFETAAQAHFAQELLSRRTAADRRQMIERLRADFGRIRANRIDRTRDGQVRIRIAGSTGLAGTVELTLDSADGDRITRLGVQVGGPEAEDADPPPPIAATMDETALAAALDAYLAPKVASDAFSGVVLVARDGAPVYQRAFGLADRGRAVPNTVATRFNVGSIN